MKMIHENYRAGLRPRTTFRDLFRIFRYLSALGARTPRAGSARFAVWLARRLFPPLECWTIVVAGLAVVRFSGIRLAVLVLFVGRGRACMPVVAEIGRAS